MCGIAGIIGPDPDKASVASMLKTMAHRGPDHSQIFRDQHCVLGHNRLAIIDLSAAANQPFSCREGRYQLVFNGMIYNYLELRRSLEADYRFHTDSDTEVLLAAYLKWGSDCLLRLRGMFSFAVWDSLKKQLFAARDPFGVKPFYYHTDGVTLLFASEIKGLHAGGVERTPNEVVWADYLTLGSYGNPWESFWKGISQLPGGHCLNWESGELKIDKWYDFPNQVALQRIPQNEEEVIETYHSILLESIGLRFRSDVPVGFNVSGGLDSSALLYYVNHFDPDANIHAFSFYTGDSRYDELPWVERLIGLTGNPLHAVLYSPDEVIHEFDQLAQVEDEPFGGIPTMAYAKLFRIARDMGVKVLLDGQGMDEQWAGYDYYRNGNNALIQGVKGSACRPGVLNPDFSARARSMDIPTPFEDPIRNLQYRDLFYTKLPRALRFNDRISMLSSTELREPFLDHKLVEFAVSLPTRYKIQGNTQKYALRRLMSRHLPESLSLAPKRPLQTPQREWLAGDLKEWVIAMVEPLKAVEWFDGDLLQQELNKYFDGDQNSSFHIWQWVNTGLLLQHSSPNIC